MNVEGTFECCAGGEDGVDFEYNEDEATAAMDVADAVVARARGGRGEALECLLIVPLVVKVEVGLGYNCLEGVEIVLRLLCRLSVDSDFGILFNPLIVSDSAIVPLLPPCIDGE